MAIIPTLLKARQLQWVSEIRKQLKFGLFEGRISNDPVFKWSGLSWWPLSYGYSPNHLKTRPFKIRPFLSGFQMVFDKMAAICQDFKWLSFLISDPISNPDHLQPNLYWTIWNLVGGILDPHCIDNAALSINCSIKHKWKFQFQKICHWTVPKMYLKKFDPWTSPGLNGVPGGMTDWVQGLGLLTTNGTQKTLPSAVESKKMIVI